MSSFRVRALMVACSLLLVMPPGWCCLPTPARAETKAPAPAQPKRPSCCAPVSEPAGQPEQAPVQLPTRCCCERDSTAPPTPEAAFVAPAADLAATLLFLTDTFSAVAGFEIIAVQSPPLQLLHCVWLC